LGNPSEDSLRPATLATQPREFGLIGATPLHNVRALWTDAFRRSACGWSSGQVFHVLNLKGSITAFSPSRESRQPAMSVDNTPEASRRDLFVIAGWPNRRHMQVR